MAAELQNRQARLVGQRLLRHAELLAQRGQPFGKLMAKRLCDEAAITASPSLPS